MIEMYVQLFGCTEIGPPAFLVPRRSKVLGHLAKLLMAVVRQPPIHGSCDQAMDECAPHKFGGNQVIAASIKFLVSTSIQLLTHGDVLLLIQGATALPLDSRLAKSMVLLAK